MNDAEISRRLALAIGYSPEDVVVETYVPTQFASCKVRQTGGTGTLTWFRSFDYRDPAVIWPIAERFNCFPRLDQYKRWFAGQYPYTFADTAAKAVALAVIKAHEGSKT